MEVLGRHELIRSAQSAMTLPDLEVRFIVLDRADKKESPRNLARHGKMTEDASEERAAPMALRFLACGLKTHCSS